MLTRFSLTCIATFLLTGLAFAGPPVMRYPAELDRDGNRISDELDRMLERAGRPGEPGTPGDSVRIVVSLMERPRPVLLEHFSRAGGRLRHVYEHALYGFAGTLPTPQVRGLARVLGQSLCIMEPDVSANMGGMDRSVQRLRARPLVWNVYGLEGDAGTTIGIVDSGVDTTHADLVGRTIHWYDFVPQTYADAPHHGTSCISLATGTGASLGNVPVATIYHEFGGTFPSTPRLGHARRHMRPDGASPWTYDVQWSGTGSIIWRTGISTAPPTDSTVSSAQPFHASHPIPAEGDYGYQLATSASGPFNTAYTGVMTYPYVGWPDGYNLFRGVAPGCRIASVRVTDPQGISYYSTQAAALDYIASVAPLYNIKVVTLSQGFRDGGTYSAWDNAASNLMSSGTVLCGIAQNGFPNAITTPGRVAKIITVGAINDRGQVTAYSQAGAPGSGKPDVLAPGGTSSSLLATELDTGVQIMQADSNAPEATEVHSNSYRIGAGTSYAAPQVAGLAALVIQAMETSEGHVWGYTEAEALSVKTVILATATETNQPREGAVGTDPVLDRGARDNVEGFGQVNADAAVEAIINDLGSGADSTVVLEFADSGYGRRAWATGFRVCSASEPRDIQLDVPATADLDLFVYARVGDATGTPVLVASSTDPAVGADESVTVPAPGGGCSDFIVVAKKVSGHGLATMQVPVIPTSVDGAGRRSDRIATIHPNPSRGDVEIAFALAARARVRLDVYDLAGRHVRTLADGVLPEGEHTLRWDGRDRTGRDVGAGLFFARLGVDGRVHSRRLARIR